MCTLGGHCAALQLHTFSCQGVATLIQTAINYVMLFPALCLRKNPLRMELMSSELF